jgi:phosphatidylglycerophosphatase A
MVLAGCAALGVWVAGEAERLFGIKDASPIVIDEIAGMLLTYYAVPVALLPLLVGFVGFRFFDILKPLPQLEQLPGGWGIMLDDLFAGLLAQGCLRLCLFLLGY